MDPFCNSEIKFMAKEELKNTLLEIHNKSIVLILSERAAARWGLNEFIEDLSTKNKVEWIKKIQNNPTQKDIVDTCKHLRGEKVDLILAIGGGSCIDLAKAVSVFSYKQQIDIESITEEIETKGYQTNNNLIEIIAIPTTAGTGSELTQWATIWDVENQKKFSIECRGLKPLKAYIVPELTLTLPKKLTLSTGLDALAHAVEAYWNKNTTPLVQELAYRSIELILENLPKALDDLEELHLRETMCRASVLAALAFSCTRTTACHSISYPLTMLYGIPHGIAVAMTLSEVLEKNKGFFSNEKMLLTLFDRYGGLENWLENISKGVMPLKLSGFGIKEEEIPVIVSKAFTRGRMGNNPRHLLKEDVEEILENVFD